MDSLKLRRIRSTDPAWNRHLNTLRSQLSSQAEVVSARSRRLTEKVFGQPLPPTRVVERVCEDVRSKGLDALLHYTEQFDQVRLDAKTLRVEPGELRRAHDQADPLFLDAVRRVRQNVMSFQLGLLHREAVLTVAGSHELRLRYRPMRRVGVCVPGGAASYPSTLLMTVCPAQAAGVPEVVVVMPPTHGGAYNPDLLAVCQELGVREVYRVGGAQAVAAMAYGVNGLPAVDMIVGPGNLFVTLAKKHVFGQVAIDCLAGPTEVIVLADDSARPAHVAADLIAQAEHDPGSSILITWHEPLLNEVLAALEAMLPPLQRAAEARASLESFGALVAVRDENEAIALINQLGPEHLHILTRRPESQLDRIENAGAIFLGEYSPVALGDYAAGPSHVLPTGGTARFASGLTANDFLRRSSVLSYTREGLESLAWAVRVLAHKEGLTGHAASVDVRLSDGQANADET
jgi:histidinol dehydrogenase